MCYVPADLDYPIHYTSDMMKASVTSMVMKPFNKEQAAQEHHHVLANMFANGQPAALVRAVDLLA